MKRILVVDDDPDIVALVKNRLEDQHYQVISAADGDEGVIKAQQQKPDLIVMDVMMPKMSGGDAVRFLQADENTKHIPVIFLTAIASRFPRMYGNSQEINVHGQFYKVMAKPFKPDELLFEINKLTDHGEAF